MEWVRGWLMYFSAEFQSQIEEMIYRLFTDAAFRDGFLRAVVVGVVVGFLVGRLRGWYKKCRAFFLPVEVKMEGAKPFTVYQGCLFSAFKIGLVLVVVIILLVGMLANSLAGG